ncbi:MAG: CBS domain-containing protein [Pyrobaculum sp.]
MKVAAVARTSIVTCFPTTPIREVAELILAKNIGSVVVATRLTPQNSWVS